MARRTTTVERHSSREYSNSDLMMAVWADDFYAVERIIARGVDQELLDWSLVAAVHARPQVLRLLLENGANPAFENSKALNLAIRRKNHVATMLLLSYGADDSTISCNLLFDSVRYNDLGLVSTLLASMSNLPPEDRKFVEMLINLHSEARYLACEIPQEMILDERKRNLLCDAITGCLMRGEESKVRALVQGCKDDPIALAALLECIEPRDHLSPAFGRIRDLINNCLDALSK